MYVDEGSRIIEGSRKLEKLLNRFKYILIIILALIIIFIFTNQYSNIKEVIENKYQSRQQLVEKNILQTLDYLNNAYKIVEKELNQEMQNYSKVMIDKYRENPDIMSWDLEELKQQFSGYDIYIIDSSLKIIRTSNQEDLGLDFSKFGSFAAVLRKRMEGNSFEADRIDLATQTGEIKKYSYMPSPDNKYLFELSIRIQDKYPSFNRLNIFRDAGTLIEEYEMVEDISFYSVEPLNYEVAQLRSNEKPYLNPDVPELEEELARQAVINNTMQSNAVKKEDLYYRYRFFPVLLSEQENSKGWNSYVVGITYNDQPMLNEIDKQKYLFTVNVFLIAISFAAFIALVIYLLKKFEHQAYHDKLTGLANRKLFEDEFEKLKRESAESGNNIGIIFIDIDKFKEINDNYGHAVGDQVLEKLASRMKNNLKEGDLIARLGGDEFVIALADLDSKDKIIKVAKRLIKKLENPVTVGENNISTSVSGGISFYPEDSDELERLIKNADSAMYRAKREEKDIEIC